MPIGVPRQPSQKRQVRSAAAQLILPKKPTRLNNVLNTTQTFTAKPLSALTELEGCPAWLVLHICMQTSLQGAWNDLWDFLMGTLKSLRVPFGSRYGSVAQLCSSLQGVREKEQLCGGVSSADGLCVTQHGFSLHVCVCPLLPVGQYLFSLLPLNVFYNILQ